MKAIIRRSDGTVWRWKRLTKKDLERIGDPGTVSAFGIHVTSGKQMIILKDPSRWPDWDSIPLPPDHEERLQAAKETAVPKRKR